MSLRLLLFFALGLVLTGFPPAFAAPAKTPPPPARHFNDAAGFVPAARAAALDARLAQFERDTSNQLLVVISPRLPEGAALEDYTVRTAQAWGAGRKDRDNGAILFIFVADRALRIEVGYGLEGTLTDAVCHAIIENELKPRLRSGDPAGALDAAVTAMIAATRGEYRGTGRTAAEGAGSARSSPASSQGGSGLFVLIILFVVIAQLFRGGGRSFGNHRHRPRFGGGWSGGGGGGFSGGGGSFGGGGASGKW